MIKKKIKILFTVPNFTTAGSGREMMNIIEKLNKELFEPFICVETEGGALFEEAKNKGYTLIVHRFTAHEANGMLAILSEAKKIASGFKKYNFDIWQSFNWSSDFSEALIAKFSGAKYVYVKKNMNWDRAAWKVKSFLSATIVARNTTMFHTFFKAPYLRRKTYFIPGGVDLTRFYNTGNNKYRQLYNIPDNYFLVTCVAQLVRTKDQITLIRAVAEIEHVFLILAGAARDDEYVAELQLLIKELKIESRVALAGSVLTVNDLLNSSDAFVLPTTNIGGHEEGCPVALIEAMAAGVPCIASNVAGNRDLVQTNETGLLFKAGDVKELVACIKKYMTDREYAIKVAEKAREQIEKENTLEIEATSFIEMYKKMMRIK
jgi:glycosyltransferase involved in cell wall biosynthesis